MSGAVVTAAETAELVATVADQAVEVAAADHAAETVELVTTVAGQTAETVEFVTTAAV